MHIHVRRAGGFAKFWLMPLELDSSKGLKSSDLMKAENMIIENLIKSRRNGILYLDIKYEVQAQEVYIDKRYICIKLKNNSEFRFPAENNKKLSMASDLQLKNVELICDGTGLHWEELDEDLSISGILDGRFG
mgnify:CR=1 FL=1